ncbi:hypothetical protein V6N13_082304 [Hibiscus sabdariffa]|uniref:Uncharacterized protein n=1 Tax=Hibiscus sabdariffa TaxID=183260 RepID=A0ABR2Q304_9ROSI
MNSRLHHNDKALTFPSSKETKPDIEVFSCRHKRHPWSQQLKSRFDSLEDLDHPLPLDFRSTYMRLQEDEEVATRMCFSGFCADFRSHPQLSEKVEVVAKSIAANRFDKSF